MKLFKLFPLKNNPYWVCRNIWYKGEPYTINFSISHHFIQISYAHYITITDVSSVTI